MKSIFGLICLYILSACTSGDQKITTDNDLNSPDSSQSNPEKKGIIIDPALPPLKTREPDSVFVISFADNKEQTIHGRLGLKGPDIICRFATTKPQLITARIIPDKSDCNIRFNQIIMPGEKADGPFGRELQYQLKTKGDYRLIIGHNMMAGDPEVCDFEMKIRLGQ